jgi:hypothetical protein
MEKREEPFMESVSPKGVLKLKKEDIIKDVIGHYRNFILTALTSTK